MIIVINNLGEYYYTVLTNLGEYSTSILWRFPQYAVSFTQVFHRTTEVFHNLMSFPQTFGGFPQGAL